MAQTTYYAGSRAQIRKLLADLVAACAGRAPDPNQLARGIQLRIGVTVLSKVQQAFLVKSRGGMGDDGIAWKPLLKSTIANRRPAPRKKQGERPIGLLTEAQDKAWRKKFAQMAAMLRANGTPENVVASTAAKIAWNYVKKELGAKTKLEVYGNRVVDIGRDTGRMLRSLTAGVEDRPSGAPEQVFETPAGSVIVGTNVPYASPFHKRRPLWPEHLPEKWWAAVEAAAARGVAEAFQEILRGAS